MYFLNKVFKLCILGVSLLAFMGTSFADVDVTTYPLGDSPNTMHDKLVEDKFVFEKFSNREIKAVKKIVVPSNSGEEFPDLYQSTTITAKICEGRIYELRMSSVYGGDRNALLMGRKLIYKYLKDNNAVNDKIFLHTNEQNPQVVLWFSIDRDSQANKAIRGTEMVKLALGEREFNVFK